jgi:hypothetical protein
MTKLSHAASFSQESVGVSRASQIPGPRNFDGHSAIQLRIARLVDRAESPGADDFQKLKLAQVALARP